MKNSLNTFQSPSDRPAIGGRASFFTTIPIAIGTTGQGTGLGLSLSYDIVKAHGGVPIAIGMKVETKEGEGAEFIIQLPLQG